MSMGMNHIFLSLSITELFFAVLDPNEKLRYFKKHWSKELQDDVVECVEEVVSICLRLRIHS
jgi:hypothetical protein